MDEQTFVQFSQEPRTGCFYLPQEFCIREARPLSLTVVVASLPELGAIATPPTHGRVSLGVDARAAWRGYRSRDRLDLRLPGRSPRSTSPSPLEPEPWASEGPGAAAACGSGSALSTSPRGRCTLSSVDATKSKYQQGHDNFDTNNTVPSWQAHRWAAGTCDTPAATAWTSQPTAPCSPRTAPPSRSR